MLDIEIPGLDVSIDEVRIDCRWSKPHSRDSKRVFELDRAVERQRRRKRRIGGGSRYQVCDRLIGQNRVGRAHNGLSIVERIPREADAGLNVVIRLVDLINPRTDSKE